MTKNGGTRKREGTKESESTERDKVETNRGHSRKGMHRKSVSMDKKVSKRAKA